MRIKERIRQHRRDFTALMECEGCGHTQHLSTGYDDENYYENVIPNQKCANCGKSRNDLGIKGEHVEPIVSKYTVC